MKTLIDRWWWIALAATVGLEVASFIGYVAPGFGAVTFAAVVTTAALASIVRLELGVYLLAAELALGGHGYLLRLPVGGATLSLRHALFIILVAAWMIQVGRTRQAVAQRLRLTPRAFVIAYLALLTVVGFATVQGWLRYDPGTVFLDANAWLFLLLAPVVVTALHATKQFWRLTQVLAAGAVVMALKTLWLLYAFAHAAPGTQLVYRWIRDLRLGEIAHISGPVYRIFLPSQVFALVILALVTALLLGRVLTNRRDLLAAGALWYLGSLTLMVSQSRSFWVGGVLVLLTLLWLAHWRFGFDLRRVASVGLLAAFVVFTQQSVVAMVTGADAGLYRRLQDIPSEPAGASRLNQVGPLASAIAVRPLLGSGFGTAVTYRSLDPRIVKSHPGGWITTTAFELGYLDVALKIGLVGLGILVLLVAAISYAGLTIPVASPWSAITMGWSVALIGVAATHAFSPYLNHPLGLGVLLFAAAAAIAARPTTTSQLPTAGGR